jgi:hypothetical protein
MELKLQCVEKVLHAKLHINRTFMELKLLPSSALALASLILIEPLWN